MALKERYQYIEWVDEQKSDFRLMVPIVRSNGISLDNTCSAIRSYREFLGYESSGISTGFKNSKLGAEVSLRNILRDTNDPVLINRANDYLLYLSTNSFTLRRDTSYGGIFRKLNLKNSNIYTLELHPSYRHSPYVAPPETIIFRASKLKFTKPYTQVNNTTSLKKTFVDKVLNDGKTILDDIQKDIAKDQEKSNDEKPNKFQIKRISILLDIVINNFNKASAKDKELVSITIASLHKMGLPQEYFPLRKIEPLWRNSTQSCQTTRLCTGDGSLRKETSTTTTRKFSKEGLEALYFYFSTIIAHPSKLTDEEIVDNIINILNLPMGSLKMTSDLLRQIMNVSKNSEDEQILVQFIQGMILAYANDKYNYLEKHTDGFNASTKTFSKNANRSYEQAISSHLNYNDECIIAAACVWFNNTQRYGGIKLSDDDIAEIRQQITMKWEAMTGRCYAEGRTPRSGDKMAYFDQLIFVSNKKGPFKEFHNAISCELKTFGNLQYGIPIQEVKRNIFSGTSVKNNKIGTIIFTLAFITLIVGFNFFPGIFYPPMIAMICSGFPLINSIPIIEFICMAAIVTLSYYIITFSIEKSINAFKPKLDTSPQKSANLRLESMPAIAFMQDECDSKNFDCKNNEIDLNV